MRRAARVDANQEAIVKILRQCGMTVQPLSAVGEGVPDLLVGWRSVNVLLEVKDGDKPPSQQKLTQDQVNWHAQWAGQAAVVATPDEAVRAVLDVVEGRDLSESRCDAVTQSGKKEDAK